MQAVKWLVLAVLSLFLGAFLVLYMSVHPLQMSLYLFLACLALFSLVAVVAVGFKRHHLLIAILLSGVLILVGWLAMTYRVLAREDDRPVPVLTRAKGDPGDGHTAVIYLTHGEPETYDPIGWINTFKEFDKDGVSFVPIFARPFFLYQLRQSYLQVGKSDHRQMHIQMIQSLESQYRVQGDAKTRFYLSFLDDNPRPDAALIQAMNEGASKVVVSIVFLTVSNHTAEGLQMIKEVKAEDYGIPVKISTPLWDSPTLRSMFVERANKSIGNTPKSKVGVMLVGHGQPDEWDREFPTETQQEALFREEILKLFEQDGYKKENMGSAWMSFKEPKPAKRVEELVKNGVEKMVFFSAAISGDSIHSQYDIPALMHEARIPAGFPLINLGAWNNDPIVIRAIKEKIDPLIK
jgi:protoheme ferro-lyase